MADIIEAADKTAKASGILLDAGLPLHGFCPFPALEKQLLPCRGLTRLRESFPPEAPPRTVIATLFPYCFPDPAGGGRSNLSRYARVPDYHTAAGPVLEEAAGRLSFPANGFYPLSTIPPFRRYGPPRWPAWAWWGSTAC